MAFDEFIYEEQEEFLRGASDTAKFAKLQGKWLQ